MDLARKLKKSYEMKTISINIGTLETISINLEKIFGEQEIHGRSGTVKASALLE